MKPDWYILPKTAYTTDLGLQLGLVGYVYLFGDGSGYPDPHHSLSGDFVYYTKGRTRADLSYDSEYLIPNMRVSAVALYVNDPLYQFYGFNGAAQKYDPAEYAAQFGMDRSLLCLTTNFQGKITGNLHWAAGAAFWRYWTGNLQGRFADKYFIDGVDNTFYKQYCDAGLIRNDEAGGGTHMEFKAGLSFDNRNIEASPDRGIWAELYLSGSPDLFGVGMTNGRYDYLKLNARFRHFLTLPIKWNNGGGIVLAYNLAYQGTVAGQVPFYLQQNINSLVPRSIISEGLGGQNTIRGVYSNRLIGDGYAWANAELRIKIISADYDGHNLYLAANPFFDLGAIVQAYRPEESYDFLKKIEPGLSYEDFSKEAHRWAKSAGIGMKLGVDYNLIISAEFAKNLDESRGLYNGVYVNLGIGYSF